MFFPYVFKLYKSKFVYYEKLESLQVQNPRLETNYILKNNNEERMSLSTSFKTKTNASITAESALVMPIFIFTLVGLLYFLVLMSIQTKLNSALIEVGRESAKHAFTYKQIIELSIDEEGELRESLNSDINELLRNGFSTIYASEKTKQKVGKDWLSNTYIKDGVNGIHFIGSDFLGKDDVIDLLVRYQIEIPFFVGRWNQMVFIQRCRIKAWTGFYIEGKGIENEAGEEYFYITETGTVYHDNPNCTHLNLSTQNVEFYKIEILRNQSGGKYHKCELCVEGDLKKDTVYITNTGTRYHYSLKCSGLKRGVKKLPVSDVLNRNLCKRCGEKRGEN